MAADDPVMLTESAYEILKEIVADYLSGVEGARNRFPHVERKGRRPETYLARVGPEGISAFDAGLLTGTGTGSDIGDDTFGSGICTAYRRLDDGRIIEVAKQITAYNLGLGEIGGGSWILVAQDKSGTWWVVRDDSDGSGGLVDCTPRTVVSNVCYDPTANELTVEYQRVDPCTGEILSTTCVTNPSDCCPVGVSCCNGADVDRVLCGTILSATGDFAPHQGVGYPLSYEAVPGLAASLGISDVPYAMWVGDPEFDFDSGGTPATGFRLYLVCRGSDNVWLGGLFNGAGGYVPFESVSALCPPLDVQFHLPGIPTRGHNGQMTVRFLEGECPDVITGTGSGTGGGLIPTSCCPGGLPAVMHVTLAPSAGCECLGGTYPVTWGGSNWTYSALACGGSAFVVTIDCTGGQLTVTVQCDLAIHSAGSASCTLPVNFGSVGPFGHCCPGGTHLVSATLST